MKTLSYLCALRVLALIGVGLIGGCAQGPGGPAPVAATPPDPGQNAAIAAYGEAMITAIKSDQVLMQILANAHETATLNVGLVVDPNGYVEKGFMVRASAQPAVEQAVLGHLINVNFGDFSPGMPDRKLIFLLPVKPVLNSAFQMQSIALYQPNSVLAARLGSAAALASYIERVEARLSTVLAAGPPAPGVTAAIVIGLKPGWQSRSWIVQNGDGLSAALVSQLEAAADAEPAVPVAGGPIAFAIIFNAWGGGAPLTDAAHPLPMPREWFEGAPGGAAPAGPTEVPDGVFARIWP